MAALKAKPGRDIWLYGGGTLFRSLLDAGLVDTVEGAVVPVLHPIHQARESSREKEH